MEKQQKDLAYFRSNLQELLFSGFPEKAYDNKFITQRSNWALNAYSGALDGGNSEEESERIANTILFEKLYFSQFNTVLQVVKYEFDTVMFDEEFYPFALRMLSVCEHVFMKYTLTDDFEYTTEYDDLYRDLTECISRWLKQNYCFES